MITAKKFINLGLAAILVLALGLPQTDSPLLAASPERAPNLSSWSPPQTINGWWPDLSPNGRFITYGNWGESWVTDLQTGQNWDFRDPADIANRAHRCIAGQWIQPDTLTFVCEIEDGQPGFYRYEVKVGEWVPKKTADNPQLVLGNNFVAKDGHWASYKAVTQIVKDNRILDQTRPGGAMALGGDLLVHACSNDNDAICVYRGSGLNKVYTPQTPYFGADVLNGYIAYGGYGPVHGIDPSGKDVDLSAVRGMNESIPQLLSVNGRIWLATEAWNDTDEFMMLRPWGERSVIVVNAHAASFSVVHAGDKFVIAASDARGQLIVTTVSDAAPRVDLCGADCSESPIPRAPHIDSLNLSRATAGQSLVIRGSNLSATVEFYASDGRIDSYGGQVSANGTRTTIVIPADLPADNYTVRIFSAGLTSNGKPLSVTVTEEQIPNGIVCDPLPEDPTMLLMCNANDLNKPQTRGHEPGTDPSKPVVFPADGQGGIGAAYGAKTDSVLIAAGKFVADADRQIVGFLADPKTMAPKGSAFRIDSSGGAGTPKVAYSPDFEKFLVVWEDTRPCGNRCRSQYGRFVSADGTVQGSDFAINQGAAFLNGLAYDSASKKFLVLYEPSGAFLGLKTVSEQGTVSDQIMVIDSYPYQGQAGIAFNSKLNEYWVAFAAVVSGNDTANEDDRIMLVRINAQTLQRVGEPVQLTKTYPGRNRFSGAHIAYSPKSGAAMIIWMERDRDEAVAGTWGRTVYDDGRASDEYPVITLGINPVSEGFASNTVDYNPWTGSFFVASGDWDGNAWITEIADTGFVYNSELAISVSDTTGINWLNKLFAIKAALAAALGSFNITSAITPNGALTLASRNYTSVVGTSFQSVNAPFLALAPPPQSQAASSSVDSKTLQKLINQIYVWSLGIASLLAVLMTILGGYYVMTSAGNAEQATKGKEYIWGAVIGMVLLFGSYLLLRVINPDLVNFPFNIGQLTEPKK